MNCWSHTYRIPWCQRDFVYMFCHDIYLSFFINRVLKEIFGLFLSGNDVILVKRFNTDGLLIQFLLFLKWRLCFLRFFFILNNLGNVEALYFKQILHITRWFIHLTFANTAAYVNRGNGTTVVFCWKSWDIKVNLLAARCIFKILS